MPIFYLGKEKVHSSALLLIGYMNGQAAGVEAIWGLFSFQFVCLCKPEMTQLVCSCYQQNVCIFYFLLSQNSAGPKLESPGKPE